MSSKTIRTTKLTIAQWQQSPSNTSTAVSKSNGTIKCGHCCKTRTKGDVVVCTTDGLGKKKVDIFCYNCWDSTTWPCSDCNTVPDESEVVGCECCGQWVHNGCSVYIDVEDGYICLSCQTSDPSLLKSQLFNKEAELTAVVTERQQLISKLKDMEALSNDIQTASNETNFKFHVSESECSDLVSEVATLKKTSLNLELTVKHTQAASKSMKQRYGIQIKALTQELNTMRANTPAMAVLQQSLEFYQNRCDEKTLLLKNAIQEKRLRQRKLENVQQRASVAEKKLNDTIVTNRKRQHEHDVLVDVMERIVKKSRNEWSALPPSVLKPIEKKMWTKLKCKSRTLNGSVQYTASITDSRNKFHSRFDTLNELLVAVRDVYNKLKRNKNL